MEEPKTVDLDPEISSLDESQPKIPWYKRRSLVAAIVLVALLVIGSAGWFAWVRFAPAGPAAAAYAGYYERLVKAETMAINGRLTYTGQDLLSIYNSDLNYSGAYEKKDPSKPTSKLSYTGKLANKDYKAETITSGGKLFFNLNGPDLPTIRYNQLTFLYKLNNGQWYSTGHNRSMFSFYCETRADSRYPQADLPQRLLAKLKVRHANLVDANASVDGKPATHYTATVDNASMVAAYDSMNAELPDGCRLQLPGYNLWALPLKYDLWVGDGFDKAKLSFDVLGSKAVWESVTKDYGLPVSVQIPDKVVDLDKVWPK